MFLDLTQAKQASSSRTDELVLNCPHCINRGKSEDVKFHLHVNTKKGVYHCFRCQATGKIDGVETIKDTSVNSMVDKLNSIFKKHEPVDNSIDLDRISWECTEKDTPFAYKYLIDRGITESEIKKWSIRVGRDYTDNNTTIRRWSGRVLFPFITDGVCKYVVGRSYSGKEPKYLNTVLDKSYVVYGINSVKSECIVCEGIISAIAAERYTGIPSVSILGKSILYTQAELIKSRCDVAHLSLDGDVDDKTISRNIKILKKAGLSVTLIKLPPNQDPDTLKEAYLQHFNDKKKSIFAR
jgi:DNA primase